MANISIAIEVKQDVNGNYYLYLTDSEGHSGDNTITTTGAPGDEVTWSISTALANTTVSINNIYEKTDKVGNYDVFCTGPQAKNDGTGDWEGTICTNIASKETESYSIDYDVSVNGGAAVTYTDDPDLEIDPGT